MSLNWTEQKLGKRNLITKHRLVVLAGQLADGLATPIVGILSDRTNTRIGRRTPWYIFGTILVFPTFLGTFNSCLICTEDSSENMKFVYYLVLPALFNIGNDYSNDIRLGKCLDLKYGFSGFYHIFLEVSKKCLKLQVEEKN
jgi:MFS family permease